MLVRSTGCTTREIPESLPVGRTSQTYKQAHHHRSNVVLTTLALQFQAMSKRFVHIANHSAIQTAGTRSISRGQRRGVRAI